MFFFLCHFVRFFYDILLFFHLYVSILLIIFSVSPTIFIYLPPCITLLYFLFILYTILFFSMSFHLQLLWHITYFFIFMYQFFYLPFLCLQQSLSIFLPASVPYILSLSCNQTLFSMSFRLELLWHFAISLSLCLNSFIYLFCVSNDLYLTSCIFLPASALIFSLYLVIALFFLCLFVCSFYDILLFSHLNISVFLFIFFYLQRTLSIYSLCISLFPVLYSHSVF